MRAKATHFEVRQFIDATNHISFRNQQCDTLKEAEAWGNANIPAEQHWFIVRVDRQRVFTNSGDLPELVQDGAS